MSARLLACLLQRAGWAPPVPPPPPAPPPYRLVPWPAPWHPNPSLHSQIELIPKAAAGAAGAGGAGGPRTLSSGIRISGEKGGTRMVQLTRHFQQASWRRRRCTGLGRLGRASMLPMLMGC